jgi:hypothetical protein
MSGNTNNSGRKLSRLIQTGLAALALMLMVSPGFAAGPQPPSSQPPQSPSATCPPDGQCFADVPSSNPFFTFVNRIYQQDLVSGYPCGGPGEPCDVNNRPYYRPVANVTRQQMAKFIDNARRLPEIHFAVASGSAPIYARNDTGGAIGAYSTSGQALTAISQSQSAIYAQTGNSTAVYGVATGTGGTGVYGTGIATGVHGFSSSNSGVWGQSTDGFGVSGTSTNDIGVSGTSNSGVGVGGTSNSDIGVFGGTSGTASDDYGVWGSATAPAYAGYFDGNVNVTGTCCGAGAGSFRIDHPLDPANQYLYHSAVESPDMKNIYDGIAILDDKGEAWIEMPNWFDALNRDFRYQLTPIGASGRDLHIAHEIEGNRFEIAGGKAGMKVSWQVTGIRQDPYANAHRIPMGQDKPANEQGKYLHPTEWGQPASSGIDYEKQQQMQQMQQAQQPKP